ncbi:hypothetical protein AGMMS50293_26690 [Spirochaetia bacterium]|nr:hypothetical protein AGMMS50293_26690 [Spirochaetia bacterium]
MKNEQNPRTAAVRAFITEHLDYPLSAPEEQWEDRAFCLAAITLKRHALRLVKRSFWQESDFCMEAVKRSPEALEWANEEAITAEICQTAVKQDGEAIASVPRRLLTEALILEAVKQNGLALYSVPRTRLTKEIVETAVLSRPAALAYVPGEWREEAKAALNRNRETNTQGETNEP